MKKNMYLLGSFLLFIISIFGLFPIFPKSVSTSNTIKGSLLINRLYDAPLNLTLIYSDFEGMTTRPYQVTASKITPIQTSYAHYTEGFIETDRSDKLLEAINTYRVFQNLAPITYYYNYIELDGFAFISLIDDLDALYIVNLSNFEVTCPAFDSHFAKERQYVYHIVEGENAYYILTAQANSYDAFWYALDKDDFNLVASKQILPPSRAVSRNQYALDTHGNAYFIGTNSVQMVTATDEYIHIPLNFNPDLLYYTNDKLYVFSLSELFLSYASYSEEIGIVDYGQFNLPNKFVSLVSLSIKKDTLYTVTYDPTHVLYRNYITLYNLENQHMLYCLALKPYPNHALFLQAVEYDF